MKKNWLSILLIFSAITVAILADSGHLPRAIRNIYDFRYGDKIGHFLLMGLLSYVLTRNYLASHVDFNLPRVILTVILPLAFFVTLEEFSQQFFPRRTFSLKDLASSYAGIISFAWLAIKTKKEPSD